MRLTIYVIHHKDIYNLSLAALSILEAAFDS